MWNRQAQLTKGEGLQHIMYLAEGNTPVSATASKWGPKIGSIYTLDIHAASRADDAGPQSISDAVRRRTPEDQIVA